MLEIEEREQLLIDIRKMEKLLSITSHPEKRKKLEYKLRKLYKRMNEILWNDKQENKMIEIPKETLQDDNKNGE